MRPALIVVGLLAVPLLAGCAAKHQSYAERCPSEIRLSQEPQPLGSSKALTEAIRTAGGGQQAISFGEVTRAAGWSDDWDAVIDASAAHEDDLMNKWAETPPGTCWAGLPPRFGASDPVPSGYYVFLKDRKVVQSVKWDTGHKPMEFGSAGRLTHESMLNPKGGQLRTY
ncbi:hypothetical protein AB0I30_07255 [Nocardia tengchongensis]|uniref:hypothetical protein n=1 Tax=Nocardia tengchongensis TaxID=2055889 RepID=UPI00340474FA